MKVKIIKSGYHELIGKTFEALQTPDGTNFLMILDDGTTYWKVKDDVEVIPEQVEKSKSDLDKTISTILDKIKSIEFK